MVLLILLAGLSGYSFTQTQILSQGAGCNLVPDGKENNGNLKKIIYSDSCVENFGTFGRCLLNFLHSSYLFFGIVHQLHGF